MAQPVVAWAFSDGKAGHENQTRGLVPALTARIPLRCHWIRAPRAARLIADFLCARFAPGRDLPDPDLLIGAGHGTHPALLAARRARGGRAVVLMKPTLLPLRRFDLAFVPRHDGIQSRPGIVSTHGALSAVTPAELDEARERLRGHPRWRLAAHTPPDAPVVAVLLGGDTDQYRLTTRFAADLVDQVLAVCERMPAVCLVTTSRRTPADVERWLGEHLEGHTRCGLLLLASRDQLDGTLEGMLGWAQVIVVTSESVSMISEACASGRWVIVVEPPVRQDHPRRLTKAQRYVRELVAGDYVHSHRLPDVSAAIQQCLRGSGPPRPLQTYAEVCAAVKRLL